MTAGSDVVVVGGGMVGAALGCALAQEGFAVALVEAREPQRLWPEGEIANRVSAISRASERILRHLSVWKRLLELGVSPYRHMFVWDAAGTGSLQFDAAEIGEPDLGHIIENRVIQLALWERLESMSNVKLLCPAQVTGLSPGRLELADGTAIEAALIVGADGARSRVRELAGIKIRGWSYDQQALVANVGTREPHRETARQRFLPSGPLAVLPLADGRCSIVWSTSPEEAERLLRLEADAFCRELTQASEQILGEVLAVGPRALFPLALRHAETYVQPGLALVGDAAHSIHPLAGQGVNLGLLDATALTDTLMRARSRRRSIGSLTSLRGYELARKGDNLLMQAAMEAFLRLFSARPAPLPWLRNWGLDLTDTTPVLKYALMRRAMGLVGELPRLAREADPDSPIWK